MDLKEQISVFTHELTEGSDYFLVDLSLTQNKRQITVYIDGDHGVDIDYCGWLSRNLGEKIDAITPDDFAYNLSVSSPGADKPLQFARQYPQHLGRTLEVTTNDGEKVLGTLTEVNETSFTLTFKYKEKGKKAIEMSRTLAYPDLKEARIQIAF